MKLRTFEPADHAASDPMQGSRSNAAPGVDRLLIGAPGDALGSSIQTHSGDARLLVSQFADVIEIISLRDKQRTPLVSFSLMNELNSISDSPGGRSHRFTITPASGPRLEVVIQPVLTASGDSAYLIGARAMRPGETARAVWRAPTLRVAAALCLVALTSSLALKVMRQNALLSSRAVQIAEGEKNLDLATNRLRR